ncbi:Anhydro-N-acetylmuramic acid kinase [hydrothermal vent metagenome]|uniref:Anhydro-N-acetylmuramic acid kinase n=1 Tax=hydrothermal vent metagenome TaxID=652676 RepID=A0A3B1CLA2_9ZZZZ
MSGTSMDGVDAVACDIRITKKLPRIRILASAKMAYSTSLKNRLISLSASSNSLGEVCELNVAVAEVFAKSAIKVMAHPELKGRKVKIIGSHGQTIWHAPKAHATLQIGDGAVIAAKTGASVWSDFRSADMANDGEGAPLAPIVHSPLFGDKRRNISVVNIGGIANITHIPAGATDLSKLIAYDTGPGNMLIDLAVNRMRKGMYDRGGRIAASGTVDEKLLKRFLAHPYFKRRSPKSTGRETFGESFIKWAGLSKSRLNASVVATFTELTARTIAGEITKLEKSGKSTDRLVICGGGAKNRYLLKRIESILPKTMEVVRSDQLGVPCQLVEGSLIALLAFYADNGVRLDLSSITGAKNRSVLLGRLTPV